ncbi:DUF5688 family protein [Butyrivibrio sp. VCB2006]|uniref:DUF5688 family protein n=1 Tax=Butyrivibrio sp. VCB2006 TaxID=1280679 RepID=UPI0012DCBAE6|nr:DUF5688 family protein [Butyrivibrio sp. VCB2006]
MKIEDFGMVVADEIRIILGSEYTIEYKEVTKTNGVTYHALLIKKENENIAPTIYIDSFYNSYKEGTDRKILVNDIITLYRENVPKMGFDVSFFTDFSNACKHLSFKVMNYKRNKKELMDIPYKKLEDLALVPICLITDDALGEGSITIKNEHLRHWEVSFDELWENVWENAEVIAPVKCRGLFETVNSLHGGDLFDPEDFPRDMFVVSNTKETYGAAAAFYPGYLEKLSEELGKDLVVLPSSVHETIVMCAPDDRDGLDGLIRIVQEVNQSVICEEDFLSESIYYYSMEDKKISAMNLER